MNCSEVQTGPAHIKSVPAFGQTGNGKVLRAFLRFVRENKCQLHVYLVNGIRLSCQADNYNDDVILSRNNGTSNDGSSRTLPNVTLIKLSTVSAIEIVDWKEHEDAALEMMESVVEEFESNPRSISTLTHAFMASCRAKETTCEVYLLKSAKKAHEIIAFDDFTFLSNSDVPCVLNFYQGISTYTAGTLISDSNIRRLGESE